MHEEELGMEQQLNINMKRLWELAQEGLPAEQIMRELGIHEMAVLKSALMQLMQEKSETINVPGLIGASSINARYDANGIRIPEEMLACLGGRKGDFFRLMVEGNRITIEKLEGNEGSQPTCD